MVRSSLGLIELIILGGAVALVLLIAAIIVGIIIRKRNPDSAPSTTRGWVRIIVMGLALVIVVPIIVVALGIILVTPIRRSYSPMPEGITPGEAVIVVVTPQPASALPSGAPTRTPWITPTPNPMPTATPRPALTQAPSSPLFDPATPAWFVNLLVVAGLVMLISAVIITPIVKRWRKASPIETLHEDHRAKRMTPEKLRYGMLAFVFWFALSLLLVLDFAFAVSVYLRVLVIYTAFWVLVGVLLLHGAPMREKVLILVLLVTLLFSTRFIDWNSRKAFLRDLDRVKPGMTAVQVEQIMGNYMRSGGVPLDSPETETNEAGEIINGAISYRHTDAGWGDSDWGVITFENGRVLETKFLPD